MCDGTVSETIFGEPSLHLKSMVGFAAFAEISEQKVERIEPAQPRATIVICLDNEIGLGCKRDRLSSHRAFVVGPGCGPIISSHGGNLSCIEVDLAPWAAPAMFGTNLLADEVIDLDLLVGSAVDELIGQLVIAPDWSSRFALVECFLERRLGGARREINSEVRWAWTELCRTGGQVSIAALAREIGWSGRHFGRRFWEETGVKPKVAARRLRFDRARRMVQETSISLADAALDSGYSDQSHMTREFVQFAGCAPAVLRTVRFADLPGTPSSAAWR